MNFKNIEIKTTACLILITITGCATEPKVLYEPYQKNAVEPGDVVVGFEPTNIIIQASADKSNTQKTSDDKGSKKKSKNTSNSNDTQSTNNDTECTTDKWFNCLKGISITSKPGASSAIKEEKKTEEEKKIPYTYYLGKPNNGFWNRFWNGETQLFPEYYDTYEGTIKSIKFGSINVSGNTIAGMAAGAATGSAFGPYGIAVGAFVGGVVGVTREENLIELYFPDNLCNADKEYYKKNKESKLVFNNNPAQIKTAVIPYQKNLDGDKKGCWHLMPQSEPAELTSKFNGWVYRFDNEVTVQSAFKTEPKLDYFKSTDYQDSFPVPACRNIDIQITWWTNLKAPKDSSTTNALGPVKYNATVADPDYVEVVTIPKNGGTITPMTICGANVSKDGASAPSSTFDELVKGIDNVLKAQPTPAKK